MTTSLSKLILCDASIHIRIECEAEKLSNIRQCDVLESKNTRTEWEWTTFVFAATLPVYPYLKLVWGRQKLEMEKDGRDSRIKGRTIKRE